MTKLYPIMAFTNIKSNRRTYIPYIISCIFTVSVYYIVCSLADNPGLADIWGGNILQSYMGFGQIVISIFAFIFLFYVNSFLLKRRRSEFGLYNILGMEKRHVAKVILLETVYAFIIAIVIGLIIGILLDKLMYLIIIKMLGGSIPMGFYISGSSIQKTLCMFGVIFFLMLLNSVRQIYKSKPVELLKSADVGEREPKAKWILSFFGIICLGTGYYIAVTTENPVAAFVMFFVAVILVIIGTYLLFTAGSIALLKLLRKNKGYYYKTKHFISVSSMMYRMKRNAVGLANICILSTMVLVMVSATLSMYIGIGDSIEKRYPSEFQVVAMADDPLLDDVIGTLEDAIKHESLLKKNTVAYRDLAVSAIYEKDDNTFATDPNLYSGFSAIQMYDQLSTLIFVPLEDYNRSMGKNETLKNENDVLVYSNRMELSSNNFNIFDYNFNVKKKLNDFMKSSNAAANISNSYFIVVKDMSVMDKVLNANLAAYGEMGSYVEYQYMADIAGNPEKNQDAINRAYERTLSELDVAVETADGTPDRPAEFTGYVQCRSIEAETFGNDFVGLFFISIFLGLLFIMATVLIMYYKQLTEGYEDKKRFEILQNVGMSHKEVKRSINSQVLIVFFLPLATAGLHVAFAFPFIYRILMLMNLFNLKLFTICTIGCFLVFTIFYVLVYKLTSGLYYRIVKK